MADKNSGIIDPPIDELLSKVDSKYQLVIFASTRTALSRLTTRRSVSPILPSTSSLLARRRSTPW